ncbi:MAG TPA: asparagine synthase (glutamine-hydrolyzing) [Isosphaeraceae bacterium]|jgi:asparagine synthase (glutamine-hydrolysing)
MCGINGLAGAFGADSGELLARMNAVIAHRGPDDQGVYLDPAGAAGLGHRRLSILDLSPAGHQPMADPEGRVHLVFNGEIYNYRELRSDLEARGHRFRSQTDTEVLLHLYLEQGEGMLRRLNGMFAFALWDRRTATLFAARDHFGIKPFYYAHLADGRLLVSSEVKGLLACPDVPRAIHLPALADYLAFLWVADPLTMFQGILKLPPGHKLRWHAGRLEVEPWWDLDYSGPLDERSEAGLAAELAGRLDAAVRRQLISDVPLGAFLSGGLDSSGIVAAMAAAHRGEVRCYTMAFDPGDNAIDQFADDLPYARQVAAHLGVQLREVRATPDIAALWPKLVWHLDEPLADPAAINCYLIAQLAREDGTKVLLSGQGADELFAGYRWHKGPELMRPLGWLPRPVGRSLAGAARLLPGSASGRLGGVLRRTRKLLAGAGRDEMEQFATYCQWTTPAERRSLLHPEVAPLVGRRDPAALTLDLMRRPAAASPLDRRLYRDLKTFLPALNLTYTDKSGMATGLECRVPFLDIELVEFAARLPGPLKIRGRGGKYLLRQALTDRLPRSVLHRPKTGFGVPLRRWIKQDLREMVGDLVSEANVRRRGLFRPEAVARLRREVDRGSGDHAYLLWMLLTLELWQRAFLDAAPAATPAGSPVD